MWNDFSFTALQNPVYEDTEDLIVVYTVCKHNHAFWQQVLLRRSILVLRLLFSRFMLAGGSDEHKVSRRSHLQIYSGTVFIVVLMPHIADARQPAFLK
jgi:hypothetical protein